jgi:lactoylglutathione lyase
MARTGSDLPVLELRVALTGADFERLMRFYSDGLGLEPAELWTNDGGKGALLEMGQGTLEIFDAAHAAAVDEIETGPGASSSSGRSGHIRFALRVPDLQAALERLLSKGATLVHAPARTPWGISMRACKTPTGCR